MKKWLIYTALTLLVLFIGVFFIAKSYLTKNYLVEQLEGSINSRVQIGAVNVSWSGEVELRDVIITERDAVADAKTPHDDRSAMTNGDLQLDSLKFDLSFREIISRKVSIESIHVDGLKVQTEMLEDGGFSVEQLFDNPDGQKEESKEKKRFNAKEHDDFVTEIREINITNLDIDLTMKKTQLLVQGRGLFLKVSGIQVNPDKLETVNNATLNLGGKFGLFSLDKNVEYGKVGITGDTNLTIFNSTSGDLEPEMEIDLIMSPDSYLTTKVPLISNMWDRVWRTFDMLASVGVNKVRLPERAEFRDHQKIKLGYRLGVVDLLESFSIHMSDWELMVEKGSSLNTGADLHRAVMKLFVASKTSQKVSKFLAKSDRLGKLLGKLSGESVPGKQSQAWLENGRIVLAVESSGSFEKPKLRIKNDLAGPIKGLLEGLIDKGEGDRVKQGINLLEGLLR